MKPAFSLFLVLCLAAVCTGHTLPAIQSPDQSHEGIVRAGGFKVRYTEKGAGPALILLHAGLQDGRMWEVQIASFSRYYRVIALDLPGHGRSTGIDSSIRVSEVIAILMDSCKIQKASFIGLSFGSVCLSEFVLAHPERVDKVILVSPGLIGGTDVLPADSLSLALFRDIDSADGTHDLSLYARAFMKTWCVGPFRDSSSVAPSIRDYIYSTTLANRKTHDAERRSWRPFGQSAAARPIASITRPTLIIIGDKDVPYILSIANLLHRQIKSSRLSVIPGAAHMLNMEKPEIFNREVLAFLRHN